MGRGSVLYESYMAKRYVIAGGPGIGKSTLVEILASRGHTIVPESARIIIEEEKIKKSDALPWKDVQRFQELVAKRQLKAERECKAEVAFLDRGILDGYAYCRLEKVLVPKILMEQLKTKEGKRRYDAVFLLDPLPFYEKDENRRFDQKKQLEAHKAIEDAYAKHGYKPIRVPVLPPQKRADFVLKNLS